MCIFPDGVGSLFETVSHLAEAAVQLAVHSGPPSAIVALLSGLLSAGFQVYSTCMSKPVLVLHFAFRYC